MSPPALTVFISSTLRDLENYRRAAVEECHRLHLLPTYMELFEAETVGATEASLRKLDDADLYVGIVAHRYGYIEHGYEKSVTELEFDHAEEKNIDRLCFIVDPTHPWTPTAIDFENRSRLETFKHKIYTSPNLTSNTFNDVRDFQLKLHHALSEYMNQKRRTLKVGPEPDTRTRCRLFPLHLHRRPIHLQDLDINQASRLAVLEQNEIYSSFHPEYPDSYFLRLCVATTPGFVDDSLQENKIFLLHDPIRPFEIQIGETRSKRKYGAPRFIPDLTYLDLPSIEKMYPFIHNEGFKWLRMVIAELSVRLDVLQFIHDRDEDPEVKRIAAQNPSAPDEIKQIECPFCNPNFRFQREIRDISNLNTIIFPNDYPYGPHFHYIVMPREPIHSWEDIEARHLHEMNHLVWSFLRQQKIRGRINAAGVFIGLNSSVKHLVLAKKRSTSAGASVSHVHKQIWGMATGSVNLGNYLASICDFYQKHHKIDYLDAYLTKLRDNGMVICENDFVALYVPFGQVAVHELQVMVKRETHSFLELNEDEVAALSEAEFLVTRFFKEWNIASFNEVLISEPFSRSTTGFRLILAFITREVDLAVSELNQLYVVDRHPTDTKEMVIETRHRFFSPQDTWR